MQLGLFQSFLMAGFECSTHRRADGQRLDLIAATGHDHQAASDYAQLRDHGISTVRDGVRWHLVEPHADEFDWSSFDPMLGAARATGTQVIWDLLHYGWPDWTDPFDPAFAAHFARFAGAAARRIGPGGFYVPINEISFLAWAGGEAGHLNPLLIGRGEELKRALCRAAIAASRAIRARDPAATLIAAEPLIKVHPRDDSQAARAHARGHHESQYDAVAYLLGRACPELGGEEDLLDVIGLNYYPQNQWWPGNPVETLPADCQSPLADLIEEAAARYRLPLFIAETGCEGARRPAWFRDIRAQLKDSARRGIALHGLCLYPILDHPGWDDDRHCLNGLLCGYSAGPRDVFEPLADAIAECGFYPLAESPLLQLRIDT